MEEAIYWGSNSVLADGLHDQLAETPKPDSIDYYRWAGETRRDPKTGGQAADILGMYGQRPVRVTTNRPAPTIGEERDWAGVKVKQPSEFTCGCCFLILNRAAESSIAGTCTDCAGE
mgnify:CR=1 FL=1